MKTYKYTKDGVEKIKQVPFEKEAEFLDKCRAENISPTLVIEKFTDAFGISESIPKKDQPVENTLDVDRSGADLPPTPLLTNLSSKVPLIGPSLKPEEPEQSPVQKSEYLKDLANKETDDDSYQQWLDGDWTYGSIPRINTTADNMNRASEVDRQDDIINAKVQQYADQFNSNQTIIEDDFYKDFIKGTHLDPTFSPPEELGKYELPKTIDAQDALREYDEDNLVYTGDAEKDISIHKKLKENKDLAFDTQTNEIVDKEQFKIQNLSWEDDPTVKNFKTLIGGNVDDSQIVDILLSKEAGFTGLNVTPVGTLAFQNAIEFTLPDGSQYNVDLNPCKGELEKDRESCRIRELVKLDQINKFYEAYGDDWRMTTPKLWSLLGGAEGHNIRNYNRQDLANINEVISTGGYTIQAEGGFSEQRGAENIHAGGDYVLTGLHPVDGLPGHEIFKGNPSEIQNYLFQTLQKGEVARMVEHGNSLLLEWKEETLKVRENILLEINNEDVLNGLLETNGGFVDYTVDDINDFEIDDELEVSDNGVSAILSYLKSNKKLSELGLKKDADLQDPIVKDFLEGKIEHEKTGKDNWFELINLFNSGEDNFKTTMRDVFTEHRGGEDGIVISEVLPLIENDVDVFYKYMEEQLAESDVQRTGSDMEKSIFAPEKTDEDEGVYTLSGDTGFDMGLEAESENLMNWEVRLQKEIPNRKESIANSSVQTYNETKLGDHKDRHLIQSFLKEERISYDQDTEKGKNNIKKEAQVFKTVANGISADFKVTLNELELTQTNLLEEAASMGLNWKVIGEGENISIIFDGSNYFNPKELEMLNTKLDGYNEELSNIEKQMKEGDYENKLLSIKKMVENLQNRRWASQEAYEAAIQPYLDNHEVLLNEWKTLANDHEIIRGQFAKDKDGFEKKSKGGNKEIEKIFNKRIDAILQNQKLEFENYKNSFVELNHQQAQWAKLHQHSTLLYDIAGKELIDSRVNLEVWNNGWENLFVKIPAAFGSDSAIERLSNQREGVQRYYQKALTYDEAIKYGDKGQMVARTLSENASTVIVAIGASAVMPALGAKIFVPTVFGLGAAGDMQVSFYDEFKARDEAKILLDELEENKNNVSSRYYREMKKNYESTIAIANVSRVNMVSAIGLAGLIEGGVTAMFGTLPNAGKFVDDFLGLGAKSAMELSKEGFKKAALNFAYEFTKRTLSEVVEEELIYVGNEIVQSKLLGREANWTQFDDVAITSIIIAGPMNGPSVAFNIATGVNVGADYRRSWSEITEDIDGIENEMVNLKPEGDDIYRAQLQSDLDSKYEALGLLMSGLEVDAIVLGSDGLQEMTGYSIEIHELHKLAGVKPGDTEADILQKIEDYKKGISNRSKKNFEARLKRAEDGITSIRERSAIKLEGDIYAEGGLIQKKYGNRGLEIAEKLKKRDPNFDKLDPKDQLIQIHKEYKKEFQNSIIQKTKKGEYGDGTLNGRIKEHVENTLYGGKFEDSGRKNRKKKQEDQMYLDLGSKLNNITTGATTTFYGDQTAWAQIQKDNIDLQNIEVKAFEDVQDVMNYLQDLDMSNVSVQEKIKIVKKFANGTTKGMVINGEYIAIGIKSEIERNFKNGDLIQGTVIVHEIGHALDKLAMKEGELNKFATNIMKYLTEDGDTRILKSIHENALGRLLLLNTNAKYILYRNEIADTEYGKKYSELNEKQKREVDKKEFEKQSDITKDEYTKAVQDLLARDPRTDPAVQEVWSAAEEAGSSFGNMIRGSVLGRIPIIGKDFTLETSNDAMNYMVNYISSFRKKKLSAEVRRKIEAKKKLGIDDKDTGIKYSAEDVGPAIIEIGNMGWTKAEWDNTGAKYALDTMIDEKMLDGLIAAQLKVPMSPEGTQEFIKKVYAELFSHIRNFNPPKNDDLFGWVNSQIKNKAGNVYNREYKVDPEKRTQDIDARTAEGALIYQPMSEDMSPEEQLIAKEAAEARVKKTGELLVEDALSFSPELKNKLKQTAKNINYNIKGKSYKDVKGDVNKIANSANTRKQINDTQTSSLFPFMEVSAAHYGVNPKSVIAAAQNLNLKESENARSKIGEHMRSMGPANYIKSVLSQFNFNKDGKAIGLTPTLLKAFYVKGDRSDAGLNITGQVLNVNNMSDADILAAVGLNPDFTLTKQDRAGSFDGVVKGLITQTATLAANQGIRLQTIENIKQTQGGEVADLTQDVLEDLNKISSGKPSIMFSAVSEAGQDALNLGLFDFIAETNVDMFDKAALKKSLMNYMNTNYSYQAGEITSAEYGLIASALIEAREKYNKLIPKFNIGAGNVKLEMPITKKDYLLFEVSGEVFLEKKVDQLLGVKSGPQYNDIKNVNRARQQLASFAAHAVSPKNEGGLGMTEQGFMTWLVNHGAGMFITSAKIADGRYEPVIVDGKYTGEIREIKDKKRLNELGRNRAQVFQNWGDMMSVVAPILNLEADAMKEGVNKKYFTDKYKIDKSKVFQENSKSALKDQNFEGRKKQADINRTMIQNIAEFYISKINKKQLDVTDLGMLARMFGSHMDSPMKRAANLQYIAEGAQDVKNPGKDLEYEHMIPTQTMILNMFKQYIENGKLQEGFWDNYTVAVIPSKMNNVLNQNGFKMLMPTNWEIGNPSHDRYYNMFTFGDRNLVPIKNIKDGTIVGKDFIKAGNLLTKDALTQRDIQNINKAIRTEIQYSETGEAVGASVFDFDDTLIIKGKNFVLATNPETGKTEKINSEKFAERGTELMEQGWTMDFSDFVNIRGGVEGPLFQKLKNRIKKYGSKDNFVLTARPQESAIAIHGWLKSKGIDIPLENITGLANSTGEAKALWIMDKFGEGYNDIYFVDDAIHNVKAVSNVLNQLDIKGSAVQAKTKVRVGKYIVDISTKEGKEFVKKYQTKPGKKVVFLAGGAGSGKSNVVNKLNLRDQGFQIVNQDISLEWLKKQANLPADMKKLNKEERSILGKIGHQARGIAQRKRLEFAERGEAVVVDGTGGSIKMMTKLVNEFKDKGYDVSMMFVETSLDVALDRNKKRKERSLLDIIVRKNHEAVQGNKPGFKQMFGDQFMELNTDNLTQASLMPTDLISKMDNFIGREALVDGKLPSWIIDATTLDGAQVVKDLENTPIVKSKGLSEIKFSSSMETNIDAILDRVLGISQDQIVSRAEAKIRGKAKGKWDFFVPPSAEDFKGLIYKIIGTGKQGSADLQFFKDQLFDPFARATRDFNNYKQKMSDEYAKIRKEFPELKKDLAKKISGTQLTAENAIRVFLWDQAGFEIPGLTDSTKEQLLNHVKNNEALVGFAQALSRITKQENGYIKPNSYWMVQTIASDLNAITGEFGREHFFREFIENKNVIFSENTFNKLESALGEGYVDALKNMLHRMETGKNRLQGKDKQVNSFLNWINGSVGATMFWNIRSAALQTISTVNFLNWGDNNIFKAAATFANPKQFWKDFTMIMNSPMLKQRRAGLQIDVSASELTKAYAEGGSKPQAIMAWLLEKGFTPTRIADSFAIAFGGAPFYRNRFNKYVKEGMSKADAEKQAWLDFQEIAEETQQSSRPDLISQQQSGTLGRLILAWQNTPMQMTRLTKKAIQDIVNGRGDMKENVSRVIYYGLVQNLIFGSLQSGLAMVMWGDDEEAIKKKEIRVANGALDTLLRGTGIYGAALATLKNTILQWDAQREKGYGRREDWRIAVEAINLSPPMGSKLRKIMHAVKTEQYNKGVGQELGWRIENPNLAIGSSIVEALTNLPLMRILNKANNVEEAITGNHALWQRVALLSGWSKWDVGVKDEELEEAKAVAKEKQKEIRKQEKQKDKNKKEAAEKLRKEKEGIKDVRCSGVRSNGQRCSITVETKQDTAYCQYHKTYDPTKGSDIDGDGIKEYRCAAVKTNGDQCKNRTENKNKKCYAHQ